MLRYFMVTKPSQKPRNPCFSSGPCAKPPGWSLVALDEALLGRSHRSVDGKARLKAVIDHHRRLLGIPDNYRIGIVPGSDTGAIEMAMWSMLGAHPVDVFAWDAFGQEWAIDIVQQLKISAAGVFESPYGSLPDLSQANPDHDIVFTWNGTTAGVRVPNADWIKADRSGLTFCDATSAVFAYDLPWDKLDITTWSWQKVLGGEAAHGMIALSPRAIERLMNFKPDRPIPKLFRMVANDQLLDGLFAGETINTPSMLVVEDCMAALRWVDSIGGLPALTRRVDQNYQVVADWIENHTVMEFLCNDPSIRSHTSVCMTIKDPWFTAQDETTRRALIKSMASLIADQNAGYDIAAHARAPAGFRIWCGATVESSDIAVLLPWIDWAYSQISR